MVKNTGFHGANEERKKLSFFKIFQSADLSSEIMRAVSVTSSMAHQLIQVIFKMDRYGKGEELVLDNVFKAVEQKPSFQNFDQNLFTAMCVLAVCDFLPSVPGVGISRAHAFISKYHSIERELEKKSSYLLCSLSGTGSEKSIELKRTAESVVKETKYAKQDLDLHKLALQPNK